MSSTGPSGSWSDSSREILGRAPDQVIGKGAAAVLCCAEDAELLTSAIERVRGGDDNADVTFRCQTQDSQARWLETRIGLLKGVNGSATGFVAVSRLVTDRVELERRQSDLLQRYRQVTDAVPGMTAWIVDRELRCRFAAGAGFPSLTSGPEACVDRPLAQLLSADRFQTARSHLKDCFTGLAPTEEKLETWPSPVLDALPTHHPELGRDPGSSHREPRAAARGESAHEALRRSEASFSSAFDNSPIGMAIIAPDGSVIRANDAFSRSHDDRVRSCTGDLGPR